VLANKGKGIKKFSVETGPILLLKERAGWKKQFSTTKTCRARSFTEKSFIYMIKAHI